ncbi:MAG: DUF3108 domain-containing protein [Rubrivivax sp.]
MSTPPDIPSPQPRGRPEARRWPLAATLLAVVALVHGLALVGLVAGGSVANAARAGQAAPEPSPTVSVRALPVAALAAAAPAPTPVDVQPRPRPVASAAPQMDIEPATATPQSLAAPLPPADPPAEPPETMALLQVAAASAAAAAPAAPQAGTPLPRYRAQLPPPFEVRFDMRRGAFSGQAQWRYASEGGRYRLELQTTILGQNVSHLRSEGGTSSAGLEPLRFVDGRRGQDRRAVNFQRDAPGGPRISFSGPSHELPLPEGVQDRLSWLLQLAAIIDTDPALRRPGARILMWVVSQRGEADVWTFEVTGPDTLRGDDGRPQPALALQRKADRNLDTEVRVWLDPAARHLPLRAAWRHEGEGPVVELRREALAWR